MKKQILQDDHVVMVHDEERFKQDHDQLCSVLYFNDKNHDIYLRPIGTESQTKKCFWYNLDFDSEKLIQVNFDKRVRKKSHLKKCGCL